MSEPLAVVPSAAAGVGLLLAAVDPTEGRNGPMEVSVDVGEHAVTVRVTARPPAGGRLRLGDAVRRRASAFGWSDDGSGAVQAWATFRRLPSRHGSA